PIFPAGEEVLGQLLREGTAPAGAFFLQENRLDQYTAETTNIHPVVSEKPHVFGGDQRIDEVRRDLIVGNFGTVLNEVTPQQHAVGAVYFRRHRVPDRNQLVARRCLGEGKSNK